jgi:hypothetical protein
MKLTVISDMEISLDVLNQINDHLEKGIPFILYDNKDHYMRCYPMQRRIRIYANGECAVEDQLSDAETFVIRVQSGLMIYKNFFSLVDEAPRSLPGKPGIMLIDDDQTNETEYEEDKLLNLLD